MSFFIDNVYGNYTHGTMTLGEFKRTMGDDYNDVNAGIKIPEYQRNFVWTAPLKQRYLETLSKRGPIFGFVMNYRSCDGVYELIDGQNRGKTIFEFMNDDIIFSRDQEEGGPLKYSEIAGQDKRIFDRMEIHFIKTLDWEEEECQEYFRTIQDGMKLTKGEEIHSAQNNIYQNKIVHLSTKYNDMLRASKKDGGFNFVNKRYIHYEVIGGLIKMFQDDQYYDRAGQIALKEVKKWDSFPQGTDLTEEEAQRLENLDNAVVRFEELMDYLVILRENCEPLNTMAYGRDATFIRNMFFIHKNITHMNSLPEIEQEMRFSEMNETVLTKHTEIHDQIKVWGGYGGMEDIMNKYREVYDAVVC